MILLNSDPEAYGVLGNLGTGKASAAKPLMAQQSKLTHSGKQATTCCGTYTAVFLCFSTI